MESKLHQTPKLASETSKKVDEMIPTPKSNNPVLKMEKLLSFRVFEQRDMVRRYNNYSKFAVKGYLKEVSKERFWDAMKTALSIHDDTMSLDLKKLVQIGICDEFADGVYLPKEKQIILCANTLLRRKDFENAFYRNSIKLYDHVRSTNYNFKNCKHLA